MIFVNIMVVQLFLIHKLQNIPRLAIQRLTNGFQRAEAHRFGLARL
jgi:hypothetical protein